MGREESERGGLSVCLCIIPPSPLNQLWEDEYQGKKNGAFWSNSPGFTLDFGGGRVRISILLWVSLEAVYGSRSLRSCPLPFIPLCFGSPALKKRKNKQTRLNPQVAQARNMSIGEHRHCWVTFEISGFVCGKNLPFL